MASQHKDQLTLAIKQNNEAVLCVEQHNFAGAVEPLTGALSTCRAITDSEYTTADASDSPHVLSFDACMTRTGSMRRKSSDVEKNLQEDNTNCHYIYEKPIHLPDTLDLDTPDLCQISLFIGCVATFNMALAFHLSVEARDQKGNDEAGRAILQKAGRLYEICVSFLVQREDSEEVGTSSMFTMATVNNLGLVHRQLHESRDADKCFQFVLSTLMYLTQEVCLNEEDDVFLEEEELDGFFRNVSSATWNSQVAPAA